MATIKSYTDIEQSKKLAEILPIESADMYYWCADHCPKEDWIIEVGSPDDNYECIYAWSLTALLSVLPDDCCGIDKEDGKYVASYVVSNNGGTYISDNPIDACYEMILKLHELKML